MSTEHGICPNVVTGKEGTSYCALAESSVLALRKKLREVDEAHTMQLAAISTATIQNTEKTKADRIGRENPYCSQAYLDVCVSVDREMALRGKLTAKLLTPVPKQGMKVNGTRILRHDGRGYSEMRRQMAGHLEELARRYYAGEVCVVDEFLQLYCIGEEERKGVTP